MKWRNEYGEADTGTWMMGAILVLAILLLAAIAGGGIAGELAGVIG